MWHVRRALLALIVAGSSVAPSGCIVPYSTQRLDAEVVDGDSGAPVPGAAITIGYHMMLTLNVPHGVSVKADREGRATFDLSCTPTAQWQVEAPGYWPRNQFVLEDGFRLPAGIELIRPSAIRIPLWRDPAPRVELVIPDGWRGEIELEVVPCSASATAPGQRLFVAFVDDQGRSRLEAPPILDAWEAWDVWIRERSSTTAVRITSSDPASTSPGPRLLSWSNEPPRRAVFAVTASLRADHD